MEFLTTTLPGNDQVQYTSVMEYRNYDPTEKPEKLHIQKPGTDLSLTNNVQTWDDFMQSTTIHGVKYIFERGSKLRRSGDYFVAIKHFFFFLFFEFTIRPNRRDIS